MKNLNNKGIMNSASHADLLTTKVLTTNTSKFSNEADAEDARLLKM